MRLDRSIQRSRLLTRLLRKTPSTGEDSPGGPLHGELLGIDHLTEQARAVARGQVLLRADEKPRLTPLLERLDGTRQILEAAHIRLEAGADGNVDVSPAGAWLLDNFHVVQEQIREVRASLPRGYYRELPELAEGPLAGYPGVYELATTLISHTEGRVDLENVEAFVRAFQEEKPLSIGELWAIPAMLRLGLIESVRRMALRTVQRLDQVDEADRRAAHIYDATEQTGPALATALRDFIERPPKLTSAFVSRFLQRLRARRGSFPALHELEEWISHEGLNAENASTLSTRRLALTQVVMANSITSLRLIGRLDWKGFVERQSELERLLRTDPSEFYARMTFATRDHYRHVVEGIAKRSQQNETMVARTAVELAARPTDIESQTHVGYYLIDEGRNELELRTGYRPSRREYVHRTLLRHPNAVFIGGILAGTAIALATVFLLADHAAWSRWAAVALFALIPANDIAVNTFNQLIAAGLPPRLLPKLDLTDIPPELRTAVVIPTLFPDVDAVREALETIEVQYLANHKAHLHFAILSDFTDAATETCSEDAGIVAAAVDGINALNQRYAPETRDAFYLFHRPRRWNPAQGVFMGWERKRGKLAEFNRFLRGGARKAFSSVVGSIDVLQRVRYVITLDADTVLPPEAAPLLIGALAHPLNRAVYDRDRGRVVRGYGILQPRVGVSLPSAHRSRFAAIHSGHPGVDPYTTAVSDVYQDLYGEGSFTGKGIYEVDAFEQATRGRFPENKLLSHDLIEGNYARAGLATDINVYDDYPTRYLTYARRKHRWIRGDWQLLDWLTRTVAGPDGPERNRLSMLSRWKIFDNLRRSVVEMAQLAFFIAGWTILPGSPLRWTLLGVGAVAAPWIVSLLLAVARPPRDKSWRAYYAAVGRDALTNAQQVVLALAFLPHQALMSADAIARTLWRIMISKRRLLEWQTAAVTERSEADSSAATLSAMWPATALAAALMLLIPAFAWLRGYATTPEQLGEVAAALLPVLGLWAASPAIAGALSRPPRLGPRTMPESRRAQAMRYALLHWRYFDRFVTPETQGLAPDNFQEDPIPVVALRTSPTNIGLQLLSTVSAYDLGFITVEDMTERLENAFRTLDLLDRHRGHFYNWYDLETLRVLEPAYISTVDSGNLAGHLIALRQACLAIRHQPLDERRWPALHTGLTLAFDRLGEVAASGVHASPQTWQAVTMARAQVRRALDALTDAARSTVPTASLASIAAPLHAARDALATTALTPEVERPAREWVDWSLNLIARRSAGPAAVAARLEALADRAYAYALEMDFEFLFDEGRKLFAIGYQAATHSFDPSYYDLLASEARLASFIAIAKSDVPVDHWFHLGRTLTHAAGASALVSWSGSMFEYLMPTLVMQSLPLTVLDQAMHGAVHRQIAYGTARGVPWGMSESAYAVRDRYLTYQYRAFGVPDLGLKHGLDRELVVAPYASALAIAFAPEPALANLAALERKGALGAYGFRDALDYTRPPAGQRFAVVHTYMSHHISMSLLAFTNALTNGVWPARFHTDPIVRSAELLLHERIPRSLVLQEPQPAHVAEAQADLEPGGPSVREFEAPNTPQPHVALLGQLPYTVMVSNGGGGYSQYEELAVTRWRSDATTDHTGQFCYIKDITRGHTWSAAHQPVCAPADWYRALLATDRVTFHRADGEVETRTEIAIVPADSAEVRRVTVTNNGSTTREIELTSYGEVVLAPAAAERAHPAFTNLFVQTEYHEWCTAITATRRPRSAHERSVICVHVVSTGKERIGEVTCETDRARFLGRGRTGRDPLALDLDGALSGTTGAVLDPIFSLRTRVRLQPGQSATVAFTTLIASTRKRAFDLADRYHEPHAAQRAFELAWASTLVELRELGITPADAAVFQELAGQLLYASATLGAPVEDRMRNRGSQPLLWLNGISGDLPILLATIASDEGMPTLRQLLTAHHYWRRRGLQVDLVILNQHATTYLQELDADILSTLASSSDAGLSDQPGGVFIRRQDQFAEDALLMLRATARVHVPCEGRSLGEILESKQPAGAAVAASAEAVVQRSTERQSRTNYERRLARWNGTTQKGVAPRGPVRRAADRTTPAPPVPLQFDNGIGGLDADNDYQIRVRGDYGPPAPWANVIANPHGGFIVTERGAGFTWAENSYFYRLSPWRNDPGSDPFGEVLYLRDEESREVWCPTPGPVDNGGSYSVCHSAGSSTFEHTHNGISTQLTLGMAVGAATKVSTLRITNSGATPRKIGVTAYVEWTLGVLREQTHHQVRTSFCAENNAIYAFNTFDEHFARWTSFCALSEPVTAFTADRREFIGRNGTLADPIALRGTDLSGVAGAGFDPCAALQCVFELAPGETREVVVLLGAAPGQDEAAQSIARLRDPKAARETVRRSVDAWRDRLSVITVRTPEPGFDAMINRWTLYQALACRMWARSALYQSSGAFGFRDQLQDVMAFVYAEPAVAREHILRAAARQFVEGDVQHWWHAHTGRGVRTRISDDLVWLPYVVEHYTRVTGDTSVLDERVPFLSMRTIEPHEHEIYDLPQTTVETATIYEHCIRALQKACTTGEHGLPLIGSGDWNDGMNRVGIEGRGESVWLAWFLTTTLRAFAPIVDARSDDATADEFRAQADRYVAAAEQHGWDGEWYRRAYFDDGTPLGSAQNDECSIDAIAQSWSVISGAAAPERQEIAMKSLNQHLVRNDSRIIQLLKPPFDKTPKDPGYIKGYLAGVRENGAQYTHAALWTVLATALTGDGDRAFELYQMINPLTRSLTPEDVQTYKVEPYVIAADVYTSEHQLGRGGWTWYTGSASWMYRVGLEAMLGFTKRGDALTITPCVPPSWREYFIEYRHGETTYQIQVLNPDGLEGGSLELTLDGRALSDGVIPLHDDKTTHKVVGRRIR